MNGTTIPMILVVALAGEPEPCFHLVVSDGNRQLLGTTRHVAKKVIEIFREIGVSVTWSTDPSDPSLAEETTVAVAVLPHSSQDWKLRPGTLAATVRDGGPRDAIFLFYPDVERALGFRPARTQSILDPRPPSAPWLRGLARIIAHEILHYFLPGRPHDTSGLFAERTDGSLLLSPELSVASETRAAFIEALESHREP